MILAFKPQFVKPILNGTKIHTIREDKPRRWKSGKDIHFATGVRTKNYNCFKEGKVISTQRIFITYAFNDILEVSIDGNYFYDKNKLALNDGFDSYWDFFEYFYPIIENSEDKCFSGKIIHWTDFKY